MLVTGGGLHAARLALAVRVRRLLRLLRPDARVRKCKSRSPFSSRLRQKTSSNRGSNAPRPAGERKDFCGTLMGPPRRARKSKSRNVRGPWAVDEEGSDLPVACIEQRTKRQIVAPNAHHNPNGENNLRILSPKTRSATECIATEFATKRKPSHPAAGGLATWFGEDLNRITG